MKMKVFGIFCLSFLMTAALSSCDSEDIIDQQEEVSGSENPTMTVPNKWQEVMDMMKMGLLR